MARRVLNATSFGIEHVIEPIYTGGDVCLSADGHLLATCLGEDVLLTDFTNGRRLGQIPGDGEPVTSLSLTPSGSHLVVCSRSLLMQIFPLERLPGSLTIKPPRTIKNQNLPIVKTAIDPTGSLLAAGSSDGSVRVWDIREGYITHTLHGHGSVVSSLRFYTARKPQKDRSKPAAQTTEHRLASGFEDGKLRVWNLENRKSIAFLDSHVSVLSCIDYDEESRTLLSVSRDRTAMLWDSAGWQNKATIPTLEIVETAGFLSSSVFYTAGENGQIRLWKTTGQSLTVQEKDGSAGIVQTINHSDLNFILSIQADQVLKVMSKPDESSSPEVSVSRMLSGSHDEVIDVAYVGKDRSMLAIATNVEEIRLLSLRGSENEQHYFGADVGTMAGHEDVVLCLDTDWSGSWLVSGAKDNTARLWRLNPADQAFECYETFTGHAESIGAVSLTKRRPADGSPEFREPWNHPPSTMITGSQDKTVKRWDVSKPSQTSKTSPRASYTRKAHEKDINAIDINHNSTLFASASQDRTVKIWSLDEGETIGVLRGHKRGVWSVRFSPKATPPIASEGTQASSARGFALTGSGDRTVKVWSLMDYSCLRTFEGHTNSVLKTVWLGSPSSPAQEVVQDEMEIDDEAPSVKRGVQVASAAADGLVKVWDIASSELATTLDNHTDRVWALAVHPSTNGLISAGGDGVITFWKDTTSVKVAAAAAESTARVEQDQELQNLIRAGSYREAIVLALQLNHPARLLGLFTEVTSTYPSEAGSVCGVLAVDEVLGALSDEQLLALLGRVRDWNTNAKTAPVAQRVLQALLRLHSPSRLLRLRGSQSADVKAVVEGLRVYTERHFARMEELIDESYLVDYTLQEMETVNMDAGAANGAGIANGVR